MLTEKKIRIILHFHLPGLASTLDYSGCSPSNITDQCYHTGNSIIQIHEMTRSPLGLFTGAVNTELLQDQYSGTREHGIFSTSASRYTYRLLFNCNNNKTFQGVRMCGKKKKWKKLSMSNPYQILNVCHSSVNLWTHMTWNASFDVLF